jgi:hypothetical protein
MHSYIANSTLIAIIFILFIIITLALVNKNVREKFLMYDSPKHNYKNVPELRFEEPLKEIPQDLSFLKEI